MTTTVLLEGGDGSSFADRKVVSLYQERLTSIFEMIRSANDNDVDDIAIILRIDGRDVTEKCSHFRGEIELF
jgi:hypothetical protein